MPASVSPVLPFLFLASLAVPSPGQEGYVSFARDIRPILSNHCFRCHGPDQDQRKGGPRGSGGLRLDTAEGAAMDLGGIAAVAPGNPEAGALMARVLSHDPDEIMPPPEGGKSLTEAETGLLRSWIKAGAPYAKHWAYEAPVRVAPPRPGHPVDAFIRDRLDREQLQPQPPADRATLIRRLSLDLTGLPPAPAEVDEFVNDPAPDAWERLIDRLLAAPAYGEHWARLWLDLARYADSAGYADDPFRTIWPYRDYVIRAFNNNTPFDRFTMEQLAGDLLPGATEDQRTATAFHRNTMTNSEGGTNDEEFRSAAVVDRVNTTFSVWMGTSMACAQCHTHKYDPITQHDYFSIYAIFNSTADADRNDESPVLALFDPGQQTQRQTLQQQVDVLTRKIESPEPAAALAALRWAAQYPLPIQWEPLAAAGSASPSGLGDANKGSTRDFVVSSAVKATGLKIGAGAGVSRPPGLRAEILPPDGSPAPTVKFVRIELPGPDRMLQLAEVQVFQSGKNLAGGGRASQISTYAEAAAARAIDGNTEGAYEKGSVAHTLGGRDLWWELELPEAQAVDRIVVWNRSEASERLNGFRLTALDPARQPVWQREGNPAASEIAFALNEAVDVRLKDVPADGSPSFILAADPPVPVAAGSVLRLHGIPENTAPGEPVLITTDPQVAEMTKIPANLASSLAKPESTRTTEEKAALTAHYLQHLSPETAAVRQERETLAARLAAIKPHTVPVMQELPADQRRRTRVQLRGNWQALGDEVSPGAPAALSTRPPDGPMDRLTLARWLVDGKNPLTSRVMANRFWEALYGTGIVRTSEEFGAQGELPSHPELLDWLATELVRGGWDLKRFLRLLVTSETYRQSSRVGPGAAARDPDNRLLARGPRVRLSGEMIRDQALAVSGLLSKKMFGPPVRPIRPALGLSAAFGGGLDWQTSEGEDRHRRALYTEFRRTSPYPSLTTFDAPNREVCTVRRSRTNTPLQALVTLNDPVFVEAAQALARRAAAGRTDPDAILTEAFRLVLSRSLSARERQRLRALHQETLDSLRGSPEKALALATQPIGPLPAEADAAVMAAWTAVAGVLLNLDETLMKR
ncbi:MAG: DUF1553 domain-containing protein [Verrucomicrobiaceae bacterium]|nr:MAG: DUF1553 domain-containing protein [Verrucomicrobiaceae bacterium]